MVGQCGIYKPVDARKVSPNAKERVEKNIQEGKKLNFWVEKRWFWNI